MTEPKSCPKCNGTMVEGWLSEKRSYGSRPIYELASAKDVPVQMQHKDQPPSREVIFMRCESCGFVEIYAA